MDFSTKAIEAVSTSLAEEIGMLIEAGEIEDLLGLENGIREILKETGQQVYRKVLEKEDEKLGQTVPCTCGGQTRRISRRPAKFLTVFGWVSYRRSYYGCSACGKKESLLDKVWQISPGEVSPVMRRLLVIGGVEQAFEKAKRTMKNFLLVEVNDNSIRKFTQEAGENQALLEKEWIAESQDEIYLQNRERRFEEFPERLYASLDGVQIPIEDEWRELKIVNWYQVDPVYGKKEKKAQEISYHCDVAKAQEFGKLLWATGVRRFADKAKELIFVCDGATWIWNLASYYYPKAIQIVDWYHATEYLSPIASALFSEPAERKRWFDEVKTWLWEGNVEKVIRECQQHLQGAATEFAKAAVTYYSNNKERMRYDEYRQKGYAIGSGTVESSCKQVATARLKIAGARWTLDGAIATAKARAAWLSGDTAFNALSF
jgi:hypothetical protein